MRDKNDSYIHTPWAAYIYVAVIAVLWSILWGDAPAPGQVLVGVAFTAMALIEYAFAVWKRNR